MTLPFPAAVASLHSSFWEHGLLDHVNGILAAHLDASGQFDRRADRRFAFPYVMEFRAADDAAPEATVIVGRHLSFGGLDFYHQQPLSFRRGIVSMADASGQASVQILMDVSWCRFIRQNWYLSGGRFLSILAPETVQLDRGAPPST